MGPNHPSIALYLSLRYSKYNGTYGLSQTSPFAMSWLSFTLVFDFGTTTHGTQVPEDPDPSLEVITMTSIILGLILLVCLWWSYSWSNVRPSVCLECEPCSFRLLRNRRNKLNNLTKAISLWTKTGLKFRSDP